MANLPGNSPATCSGATAEQSRATAEQSRATAEQSRATAEQSRATARVAPTIERQMLSAYPINMSMFLQLENSAFDANGVPYRLDMQCYFPVDIARYALAQWNRYCQTGDESCLESFLAQVNWLLKNELRIAGDAGGWPIQEDANAPIHLSAIAQGCGLSVLLRAYQIMSQQDSVGTRFIASTRDEIIGRDGGRDESRPYSRDAAIIASIRRVLLTFERDILDGGILAPIGNDGIFFEEKGIYPASHALIGCLFALHGLFEVVYLSPTLFGSVGTGGCGERSGGLVPVPGWGGETSLPDTFWNRIPFCPAAPPQGQAPGPHRPTPHPPVPTNCDGVNLYLQLAQHALKTLHSLLEQFETGRGKGHPIWVYADLASRRLAAPAELALMVSLLDALPDEVCRQYAHRWRQLFNKRIARLRYGLMRGFAACKHSLHVALGFVATGYINLPGAAKTLMEKGDRERVCVSIQDFPTFGGVGTVLEGMVEVMRERWQVEYLTQYLGPGAERYIIHKFGTRRMTPWYFPFVWLYVLSGIRKFVALMRHHANFRVVLPQDAVFSGALAGIAGKLTGVCVVCIDHGDLSLFTPRNKHILQQERMRAIAGKSWPWPVRFAARQLLAFYWPSRYLLARIASRYIDAYLIPGVPGDSVDEGCQLLGISPHRVTRYGSMIDIHRHPLLDEEMRAAQRREKGLPVDALVIAIACRLAPEKGLDIALESISQALATLTEVQRERVRVVIAGDGPLRQQVEQDIIRHNFGQYCQLWGTLSSSEVIALLGISDIFLYTSTRGACYAMAVLEAMASACAVVASTEPLSNALLLSEGRGFAVPAGDVAATSAALAQLLNNEQLCQQMGQLARQYIATYHSPEMFRRTLERATGWTRLHELIDQHSLSQEAER